MDKNRLLGYGRYPAALLLALFLLAPSLCIAAPYLFKDLNPGSADSNPANLTDVNGTLYFTAGQTLWKSDGTGAGTVIVKSLPSSNPGNFTNANGTLFFTLNNGNDLWKSDGTDTGTGFIKSVGNAGAIDIKAVGSVVFFRVNDPAYGIELWRSDGTLAGTAMVKDINPGTASAFPTWAAAGDISDMGGICYFNATDGVNSYQLWRSDGTAAGTWVVSSNTGFPVWQTPINGTLFFTDNGVGLRKSDGTDLGTVLVAGSLSYLYGLRACGGKLYFSATDGVHGHELWMSDGTSAGTVMVKDSIPGSEPTYFMSGPRGLTDVNGILFYQGNDGQLWKSDGTDAGTMLVKAGTTNLSNLTNVNGILYFNLSNALWKSDGTNAGTVMVTAMPHNSLTTVNGKPYFAGYDAATGWELWSIDSKPSSAVTSPSSGSSVKGTSCTVTGTATDYSGSGIQKVEVSTDGGTTWNPATGTTSWSYTWPLPFSGSYTIKSRATDNDNNVETLGAGVSVTVDNIPPTGSVVINNGAAFSKTTLVTLTLSATDSPGACPALYPIMCGVAKMQFSSDNSVWTAWENASTSRVWQTSSGDGPKTVYARFMDAAGNVSSVASDNIIVDTAAPASFITSPTNSATISGMSCIISGTATDGTGSGVGLVEVSTDGGTTWNAATGTGSWSYTWLVDYAGGHSIITRATDRSGNIETPGAGINVSVNQSGTQELQHFNWDASFSGENCALCHISSSAFLAGDFGTSAGFCRSCHNGSGVAHEKDLSGSHGHSTMVNVASGGSDRLPAYGNITTGEFNNEPFSRLKDGNKVVCVTCHNVMGKTEDFGRIWEYTTTNDHVTYTLQNGGWAAYGYLAPEVYRDTSLWSGPTYSKARKTYLVDPSEYTYDETNGTVTFKAAQPSTAFIYVTLDYPYLRASNGNNKLCDDCHTQMTHKGVNCLTCHQAHNTDNLADIRGVIRTPNRSSITVQFLRYTGANSFADRDTNHDGVCEVCHTTTKYYRRDGTGFANHSVGVNYDGTNCTACHSHATGFAR